MKRYAFVALLIICHLVGGRAIAQEVKSRLTLKGHTSVVQSVAVSSDGKTLASGSWDGTIKLWDLASGQEKASLQGGKKAVYSVAFSRDGKTLASGSDEKAIKLWDVASGKVMSTLEGHHGGVWSVAFSPDGKVLASGSFDHSAKLWDLASGKCTASFAEPINSQVLHRSVAFSLDGKTLAAWHNITGTTIKLWDVGSGLEKETLQHEKSVNSVVFHPDGKTLLSGSNDGTIRLWDMAKGKATVLVGRANVAHSLAYSPDGKTLAGGSYDGTIKLWDLVSGKEKETLLGHVNAVYSVAFSPDGKTLVSGGDDKTIKLWDVAHLTTSQLNPGDHTRTLMMGEQKRTYFVHVPKGHDPKKPVPIVLALHGAGMTGSMMDWFSGLNKKSDQAGFIVVYPSGLSFLWNAGGFKGKVAEGKPDDVAFIGKVLDDLGTVVKMDEKRVYACGMSNGAMMCYRLAAELSDRIAAIAPVAGTIAIEESKPKRPVPVIHFHGTKDTLVPFEMRKGKAPAFMKIKSVEESVETWVKLNGCDEKPKVETISKEGDELKVIRKTFDGGKDGAEVVLVVIEGGGHTWPGQQPPVGFIGKSAMNISANDLLWEFFVKHPMKNGEGPARIQVLFSDKSVQPAPDVPKEARQQERIVPGKNVKTFSKLVEGNISSVTVTYFDQKNLKEKKDTEALLRQLLTTPKGTINDELPWAKILSVPTVGATVEHTQGKTGVWLIWKTDRQVLCAYKDGQGRWWFGMWFDLEEPR